MKTTAPWTEKFGAGEKANGGHKATFRTFAQRKKVTRTKNRPTQNAEKRNQGTAGKRGT